MFNSFVLCSHYNNFLVILLKDADFILIQWMYPCTINSQRKSLWKKCVLADIYFLLFNYSGVQKIFSRIVTYKYIYIKLISLQIKLENKCEYDSVLIL